MWRDQFSAFADGGLDPLGPYYVYDNELTTFIDVVSYDGFSQPPFLNHDGRSLRLAVEPQAPDLLKFEIIVPQWNDVRVIRVSFDMKMSIQAHDLHVAFHGQDLLAGQPFLAPIDAIVSFIDDGIAGLAQFAWGMTLRGRPHHIDLVYNHTLTPVEVCCGFLTESNSVDIWVNGQRYPTWSFGRNEWLGGPVKGITFFVTPQGWQPFPVLNETFIDNLEIASVPYSVRAPDSDHDGYDANIDCNDNQPGIFPGAPEVADGLDNNCDGYIDETSTPTGTDVTVQVQASGQGSASSVEMTFSNVTQAGVTTLTQSTSGTPPPSNFQLTDPPVYFDLSTTAQFSGPVEVCFTYPEPSPGTESGLGLFHYENGSWQDVTTSLDTNANRICGLVNSLSPFALFHGDSIPPVIHSITPSTETLWPPNHKMVPVTLSVSISDNIDPNPAVRIVSVTSNEPENGLGDGDTGPDWEITGDQTLLLRAERAGGGAGRVYTITIEASDYSGNRSSVTQAVSVRASAQKGI